MSSLHSLTKQELLTLLRSSGDEVVTTLRALPLELFTRVCYADGWTGHEVVAHLAAIEWTYPRLIDLAKQGETAQATTPASSSGGIDAYNARQVAKRANVSLDDLLVEFARNRAATVAAVEATDDALLAASVRTAAGLEGPLGAVMRFVAVDHVQGHVHDLQNMAAGA